MVSMAQDTSSGTQQQGYQSKDDELVWPAGLEYPYVCGGISAGAAVTTAPAQLL